MTEIPNTEFNADLAHRVHRQLAAETSMMNAKASLWRVGGIGAMVGLAALGIGLGTAAGLHGYARVADVSTSADKLATALATALEKTNLKGEVSLDPAATVALKDGGKVGIEPGSQVGVTGSVGVNGTVGVRPGDIPRPAPMQLNGTPSDTASAATKVVTNFTVFKHVTYGKGSVVTGWDFQNSEQPNPVSQYCYYVATLDADDSDLALKIDLARDGVLKPQTKTRPGLDVIAAAQSCIWFNGQSTNLTLNRAPPRGRVF